MPASACRVEGSEAKSPLMNRTHIVILSAALLAACTKSPSLVRITNEPNVAVVQAKPRSEPIFYNGKTYKLDFAPQTEGGYAMAVSPMTAKQEKDAVAVATSALRYYACKDSQKSSLVSKPRYAESAWHMTAQCS